MRALLGVAVVLVHYLRQLYACEDHGYEQHERAHDGVRYHGIAACAAVGTLKEEAAYDECGEH